MDGLLGANGMLVGAGVNDSLALLPNGGDVVADELMKNVVPGLRETVSTWWKSALNLGSTGWAC